MIPARWRALLALLVVATFGLRTVAPEAMRGCGPGTGLAHQGAPASGHDHRHGDHQADRCECVGHSCGVTVAAPPAGAGRAAPTVTLGTTRPPAAVVVRRSAPKHVLPFAQGPPSPVTV